MEIFFHVQLATNEMKYIDHNIYRVYHLKRKSLASSCDSFA